MRVLVGGAWGFASDRRLSPEGARDAALRACGFAAAAGRTRPRALAPVDARSGSYRTPVERDPFAVPLDEKVALCLRIEESLRHPDVKVAEASLRARSERKLFVSSDGIEVDQELVECGGGMQAVAIRDGDRAAPLLPEPPRRLERAGRVGVRREPRSRIGGAAARGGGSRVAPRGRVPRRGDDGRDRPRADAAPDARVGRPSDRARPRLRHRGRICRDELPEARRPRLPPLRLRAHERHRGRHHPARPRHLRLRRRRRAGLAGAGRRGRRAPQLPHLARDRGSSSGTAAAARCAPTAGRGCRSSG